LFDGMRYGNTLAMVLGYFFVLTLTACSTTPKPYILTQQQLNELELTQQDCTQKDQIIYQLERQQQLANIPRIEPEYLNDTQREYQARIRIAVWALRIGCENPNRY
jgi:hypothetical protein